MEINVMIALRRLPERNGLLLTFAPYPLHLSFTSKYNCLYQDCRKYCAESST